MCGKPWLPAVRARPSTVSSRPCTLRPRWEARMRPSSREKNEESRKKLPSNVNENGIVGKPAGPTPAPGGSVAVAACVADAGAEPLDPPARVDPPDPQAGVDPGDPFPGAGAGGADAGAAGAPPEAFWGVM